MRTDDFRCNGCGGVNVEQSPRVQDFTVSADGFGGVDHYLLWRR